MLPCSKNSRAVSPARRRFSARSAGEKPRSPQRPWRTWSPSSSIVWHPAAKSARSSARASVLFPDAGSPVNQSTAARWPFRPSRSSRGTFHSSHTTLGDTGRGAPSTGTGASRASSRIIPAATVAWVRGSTRMKLPVAWLRAYGSKQSGCAVAICSRPMSFISSARAGSRCSVSTSMR